ncbi:MAG: methyltransferase domain-containing protein [Candidatus Aenigmarchaeota archaeon]|nr:methyltransferase domain-containing protein [Candidatus Aenigmarchaeota archaeon]
MIVLLVGKKRFIMDTDQKNFNSEYGRVDLTKIKKYGQKIKSSSGSVFRILKPALPDLFSKAKRGPQIVTQKDAAQIVAMTGAEQGWNCVDAGGGSGFLCLFISNIVKPGTVTTYERNKEFAGKINKNARLFGLTNLKVKNKNILNGFSEKNLDLITLDMIDSEKMIKKCFSAIKDGGWLCVYSPHIEQQIKCTKEMEKLGMEMRMIETMQRDWKVDTRGFTHPRYMQMAHTGFITVARKI